jgi:hypothetical protein
MLLYFFRFRVEVAFFSILQIRTQIGNSVEECDASRPRGLRRIFLVPEMVILSVFAVF